MSWHATHRFGALAALLTGALFLCSRDTGPVGPLVLVAPVPILLYAISAARGWPVAIAAFAAGGLGASGIVWAYGSVLPAMVLALWVIGQALGFMVVVVLTRWLARASPAWVACFTYPLFATGMEFLFSRVSPHGSFGAIGYALVDLLAAAAGGQHRRGAGALVHRGAGADGTQPADPRAAAMARDLRRRFAAGCAGRCARPLSHDRPAGNQGARRAGRNRSGARRRRRPERRAHDAGDAVLRRPGADIGARPAGHRGAAGERCFRAWRPGETLAKTELASLAAEISALIVAGFDEVRADGAHENAAMAFAPRWNGPALSQAAAGARPGGAFRRRRGADGRGRLWHRDLQGPRFRADHPRIRPAGRSD